jgi:hypothetical protein
MLLESVHMLSHHIARAMARERQRDLIPATRERVIADSRERDLRVPPQPLAICLDDGDELRARPRPNCPANAAG